MRFQLLVWVIIFLLGALVGERYGLPGWASAIGDRGFSAVESWFGRLDEPIPDADESEDAREENIAAAEPAPAEPGSPPVSDDFGHDDNAGLRMNEAGLAIIKESEGLRLEAYNLRGQWLIGYGHARTAKSGMTITEAEAEQLLREDVTDSENAVRKMVLVSINENQFAAMVSLAYNMGSGGFSNTTVLSEVNEGNYQGAADAFRKYNRGRIYGTLQVIPHLTGRREKERALFLTPA